MGQSSASRRRTRTTIRSSHARRRRISRLPPRPTRLIGRERELSTLQELLSSDARLATLTGPPGIGKRRLALEVAASLEDRFSDGVAFVDLAPIRDPALVMPAVAQTLGISDAPDRPVLGRLTELLEFRSLLIVLDNLEQVIGVAPQVGEFLASCSGVRVLATSREPLHLPWEREIPVPPLGLPTPAFSRPRTTQLLLR